MSITSLPARFGPAKLAFAVTFLIDLLFAAYTQHAWEDYYITFRTSKNLVQGHGLVFTPGEHVHSFTSPLGVLLPALASALTGGHSDAAALWLFRVMGAAALAGAASLLVLGILRAGAGRTAAGLGAAWLALDAKALDFSTNGMETGFLLLFLAYAFWAFTAQSDKQSRHLGVAWAGIMWTRPDGFIYIGLLAAGYLVFNHFAAVRQDRRAACLLLVRAAVVCTVLYLPWFVWAAIYYGSPVPHTIIAKGSMNPGRSLAGFVTTFVLLPFKTWTGSTSVAGALMPTYYQAGSWPAFFHFMAQATGTVAMVAWLWPRLHPSVRAASFAFHGAHAYLTYFPYFPFPWYFPATTILAIIVWSGVAGALLGPETAGAKTARPALRRLILGGAAGVLLLEAILTVASAIQMKAKQEIVYTGNLRRIGEWLAQNARPTDHVFMEPLGYIGYFSQLPAYDYPGLSSPRMVEARKRLGNGWSGLLLALTPEWAVLRASEAARIESEAPGLLITQYAPVKTFDVRAQADAAQVRDHFMLNFDADFTLYRRQFHVFADETLLGIQHQFGTDISVRFIDHTAVRLVHASGTMSLKVPVDATRFEVKYGFPEDAYQGDAVTDGATFQVIWADGTDWRVLAERTLDPAKEPRDRGLLTLEGVLPVSKSGRGRLVLHTRAGRTTTKDWTCWGPCLFR